MISIEPVDIKSRKQINDYVNFPFMLYGDVKEWVPPFISDVKLMLNPKKHPFYEHSDAEFFVARNNGELVGRIAVMENKPFNKVHDVKKAQFYLFDCIEDQSVANALFSRAFEWSNNRGLDTIVGPKGFSAFDGYGIQIEGFEHRQMMTMMNYNFPYYKTLIEEIGFEKDVDFVSCYVDSKNFILPEKAQLVAKRVREKGKFEVISFATKKDLKKWAWRIGEAYNNTFINNWEYYPFTKRRSNLL